MCIKMSKWLSSYAKSYSKIYDGMQDTFVWQVKDNQQLIGKLHDLGSKLARKTWGDNWQDVVNQIVILLSDEGLVIDPKAKISLSSKRFPEGEIITWEELKTNASLYAPQVAQQIKDLFTQKRNADNNYYDGKKWYASSRRRNPIAQA